MLNNKAINKLHECFKKISFLVMKIGLAGRLILLFIIVLAIPIIFFGGYYVEVVKSSSQNEVTRSSQFFVRQIKFNIEKKVETCQRTADNVIRNKKFVEYMAINDIGNIGEEELIKFKNDTLSFISNIKNTNLDIYDIRFFLNKPIPFEIWPVIYDEGRIQDNEWFTSMYGNSKKSIWRLNHSNETYKAHYSAKHEIVSLYRDVSYSSIGHLGILEVSMFADAFFSEIYDKALDDAGSCILVLTEDKDLIFNRNSSFFSNFPSDNVEFLKQSLILNVKGEEGNFTYKYGKERMLCVYSSIPAIGSYIFQVSTGRDMTAKVNKARNLVLLGIIGIITVLSVLTFFLISVLLKKLKIIIATMRKVQEGDLYVEIPDFGNDEIGELAYHYKKMLVKINDLISVVIRKQAAEKNAQIRALQSQINAHFIYNVLEAIRMMAEINNEQEISNVVTCLGRLMRYSMSWKRQYVKLRDEVNYVKDYITLMNVRFDWEIKLVTDISDELMEQEVLKMLLQPIVENSVIHGIQAKGNDGVLLITAAVEEETLIIAIKDNGAGINDTELDNLRKSIDLNQARDDTLTDKSGIGLGNINERLKLFYGSEYGLEIDSVENRHTTVLLRLKYKRGSGW